MLLCFPSGSFKRQTQYPILSEDGNSLSLTDNYSITSPVTAVTCTKVDAFTLTITDPTAPVPNPSGIVIIPFCTTVFPGDNVCINIDGFDTMNVITGVDVTNKKIKLKTPLLPSGSTFKASIKEYTYNILSTCVEGFYRFKDGEALLVRSAIQSMTVDFSSVIARDLSLAARFTVGDFVSVNKEALNSVYGDLSYLKKVWNVIDIGQFRELLILKILAIADNSGAVKHIQNYENFKKEVINTVMLNDEVTPPVSDIQTDTSRGSYSVRLGA